MMERQRDTRLLEQVVSADNCEQGSLSVEKQRAVSAEVRLAELRTALERIQFEVRLAQNMANLLDEPLVMQVGCSVEAGLVAMLEMVKRRQRASRTGANS